MGNFIQNWKTFNENAGASWGFGHMSGSQPTSLTGGSPVQPNDPQLTFNGFDRQKANVTNSQNKLAQMTQSIFKNVGWGKNLNDTLEIKKLKVLSILRNNNGSLNLFIEFAFDPIEDTFFGTFENWGQFNNLRFRTNFKNGSAVFNNKVEAILKKNLLKWFEPIVGDYKLKNESCKAWDSMGEIYNLKKGQKITILDVQLENTKPTIHIKYGNNFRYITDNEYWFFHWWFEKVYYNK